MTSVILFTDGISFCDYNGGEYDYYMFMRRSFHLKREFPSRFMCHHHYFIPLPLCQIAYYADLVGRQARDTLQPPPLRSTYIYPRKFVLLGG